MVKKLKSILKAFVVIALFPIIIFSGFFLVAPIAEMCFGGISHPLMGFPAVLLMLPWGFLFVVMFFIGISPKPTFVVTPIGKGGYLISSGKSRGGGMFLSVIKLFIAIPLALFLWLLTSIIILFSKKVEEKINKLYENIVENIKSRYKYYILLFVIFPMIVLGFNAIENHIYSPEKIQIKAVDYYYFDTDKENFDCEYYVVDYYKFSYTIDACGHDLEEIKGEWIITDKTTGESVIYDAKSFVPFDWRWNSADKNTPYEFTTNFAVYREDVKTSEILSKGIENLEITCKINYISFDSNIPILGDFLFPTVNNEYKNGYQLVLKK